METGVIVEIYPKTKKGLIQWHAGRMKIPFRWNGSSPQIGQAVVFSIFYQDFPRNADGSRKCIAMDVRLDERKPCPVFQFVRR